MMWPFNGKQRRQARIAKGVAALDAAAPGWEQRVDVASLELSRGDKCVLGQLFGDYYRGMLVLFPWGYGKDLAFETRGLECYDDLDRAWQEFIRDRQKVPA